MSESLTLNITEQPDDTTCGVTCLHAVYDYHEDTAPALARLAGEVEHLDDGGTLAVMLGVHALSRGYKATIYTYNLHVFDPTWFVLPPETMVNKLRDQEQIKGGDAKLAAGTRAYTRFLELGGKLKFEDLTPKLIRRHLRRGHPIITGLSSTYLYRSVREVPSTNADDDIEGEPAGHFVVLHGYQSEGRLVQVADPYPENPEFGAQYYDVGIDRVIGAIMLGILTYDANLLIITPKADQS